MTDATTPPLEVFHFEDAKKKIKEKFVCWRAPRRDAERGVHTSKWSQHMQLPRAQAARLPHEACPHPPPPRARKPGGVNGVSGKSREGSVIRVRGSRFEVVHEEG